MALQSDREYPSLLFTPRVQDKQVESSYRTKSPRSTRSPSTPVYGRNSISHREGSGRRSLTPPGGARDTPPPPPPFLSILDANKGGVTAARPQETTGNDLLAVQDNDRESGDEATQDTWVTVFGFTAQDQHVVLREFAKCGNILQFGNGREDRVNWTHIQYSNQYQAQRALLKGGQVLAGRIMVGVTRMEPQFRIAADSLSTKPPARLSASTSRQVVVRPHRLDTASGQGLPTVKNNTWAKISEFVLGV